MSKRFVRLSIVLFALILPLLALQSFSKSVTAAPDALQNKNNTPRSMMMGDNGWHVSAPLFTVGETISGTSGMYTPPGILDGLGAYELDANTVRVLANHELLNFRGYDYQVGTTTPFTMDGARVSYFDIDKTTRQIVDSGLAYSDIYDANGNLATDTSFLANDFIGFSRFCSSVLVEPEQFGNGRGLQDRIYFTGEEDGGFFNPVGGGEWALDTATGDFWHIPDMGRGAWENVTEIDTGTTTHVAFILADDSSPFNFDADPENEAAPLYLYVGEKNSGGDFLAQNGLRDGTLYVWVSDTGETTPTDFNTTGTITGTWATIDNTPVLTQTSEDGSTGYDEFGYPTQGNLWIQAEALGAFGFSRPEDVATNPNDGSEIVLASTGVDTFENGVDTFGTMYTIKTDFTDIMSPTASMTIIYDGDADPTRALRSPDNLDWADDGMIYVQEDEAEEDTLDGEPLFGEGAANPYEAGIVRLNPTNGSIIRIANIDRSVILDPSISPETAAVDMDAGAAGEWESSGILDVSTLFGELPGTMFIFDVQAHGIEDQEEVNADSRLNDDDLVEGGQLLFLNAPTAMAYGLGDWRVQDLFTIGETIDGYTPPGILDGLGAYELDANTVRVLANHELLNFRGYDYQVGTTTPFTMDGARVSYFDIDKTTRQIVDSGLAYSDIYDANGNLATDISFLANDFIGFSRFCSSVLVEPEQFGNGRGLQDRIYFTGEEDGGFFNPVGGGEWALDTATGNFWHVPAMGRGAWENIAEVDTGTTTHVAFILADDSSPFNFDDEEETEAAPLYLYVGEKDSSGDFLTQNGLRDGALYVWVSDTGETTPTDFNTAGTLAGSWVAVDNTPVPAQGSEDGSTGYDEFGYPTQGNLWLQAEALGAFGFSRPEDVATNPFDGSEIVLASTGVDTFENGVDTFGTMYIVDTDFTDIMSPTASLTILYDGDADATRALRSPDNLDWADNGMIYVQEDEAEEDTLTGEPLFGVGAVNPNEAGIVEIDPSNGSIARVANVNRSVVLDPTVDPATSAVDVDAGAAGEWESSGILDVSTLFGELPGTLFLFDVQAHGIEDQEDFNATSRINDDDLVEGGQLLWLSSNLMATGTNGWRTEGLFTVGETINGYTPPGILDGLGAYEVNSTTVRLLANHELLNFRGYDYEVTDGMSGTFTLDGARVSYFDIDIATRQIVDSGLAYDTIYDANGNVATDASFLANDFAGFSRFCSSVLVEPEQFGNGRGLQDRIYFTGEEDGGFFNPVGGGEWALDTATGSFWHVPDMGRGAWENVAEVDTGTTTHVAFILADDSSPFNFDDEEETEAAPLYLYVGEKDSSGDFLAQNGLRGGTLYVWVSDTGETTPTDFNTAGTLAGSWVAVDNTPVPAQGSEDGSTGYDEFGYPTQGNLWLQAEALGAFGFSRPEDVATNPFDGSEIVLASTGVDTFENGVDTFGTMYTVDTDFTDIMSPTASLTILYDGDADPSRALRSPDNLDWADDGMIYVQEDEAEEDTLDGEPLFGEGAVNPHEASIVKINPTTGSIVRVATVNRSVVLDPTVDPETAAVDGDAGAAGEWETSGIIDVSALFGELPGTLFIFDVQAHGIEDQEEINPTSRLNDDDLVEGGQLLWLHSPAPTTEFTNYLPLIVVE